jgi:cell wall-associated NlpC family hydrolase
MSTFDKYVGIPFIDRGSSFNGADCYGLIRLIYKTEFGIDIPEFGGSCMDTKRIYNDYLQQIAELWVLDNTYSVYNVLAMAHDPNHPKIIQHFGIYIGNGLMLQTLEKIGSFVCKVDEYSRYIKGNYKWKKFV